MNWSFLGALSMALAIICGAFGAHGLKDILSADRLAIWETAVRYQVYHSFGLLLLDRFFQGSSRYLKISGWLFVSGIFLFSGSLYMLALTGNTKLGIITPFGGVAWIVGWLLLAKVSFQKPN
jgi:uncharacterized membrane protein YgdD (TMEM256/DUF423 family)